MRLTAPSDATLGSSPLTRGKLQGPLRRGRQGRLIPAHAGKTGRVRLRLAGDPAHPRSRGENLSDEAEYQWRVGSSPLTRGKHTVTTYRRKGLRLIPAHAGKTHAEWPGG